MNRKLICNSCIIISLFLTTHLIARDFAMMHYTTKQGLPSNTIYNIYKDNKGYLWLCTDKGISRYNGIEFENFSTSNGLPDNEIFFFKEDNIGRLWLATFNGKLCYYKDGVFHTAANTSFLKLPFKKTFIQDINIARDNAVVIGFYDRSKWVLISGNSLSVKIFDKAIKNFDIDFHYLDRITNNRYKVRFTNKTVLIDSNSTVLETHVFENNKTYQYAVSQNQQYLYTSDSLYTVDRAPIAAINRKAFNETRIYHIDIYDDNIFYSTDKGLFINNDIEAFKNFKISGIERDIDGNYWISTLGDGIYSLSKDFLSINKYNNAYNGIIKYAKADDTDLFFATDKNNVYRFSKQGIKWSLNYSQYKPNIQPAASQSFVIDRKKKLYCFNDNDIFLIDSIHSSKPILKKYYSNFSGGYKSVFSDGKYIYLKRFRSIEYIDFSQVSYKSGSNIPFVELHPYALSRERIFGLSMDTNNMLWYSTIDCIYKITGGQSYSQPQYKNIAFKWFDIFNNYTIGCTHDNRLVVCNSYKGKMSFNVVESPNCIWDKLYVLDATHFILSTNNLYRILTLFPPGSTQTCSIQVLENLYIPVDAENICSDGKRCYFFKDGSITSIGIKNLLEKPLPPTLSFKAIKAANKTYDIKSTVDIPFRDAQNISISFATLAFSGTDIAHQYSISENSTDNWIDIDGDINIIHPGFGYYTVKVRAKSISSNFSEPIIFTLHIHRPYWATWWFMALSSLFLISVFAAVVRHRISFALLKKQKMHDDEIRFIKSEYKAMNALMNPHFIFNTLNNVQDLINKNDKRAANEYLRFFADLIRQNMLNISKELVSLQMELNLATNYLLLEKLRFEDFLNYSIEVDENIDLSEIMVPPLLIQPLVENAIKHGIYPLQSADGHIRLRIYEAADIVYIEVMDNGIGMNAAKNRHVPSHESFGLHNIKTRIEQLSLIQNKEIQLKASDVKDDTGKLLWTIVTISIPIS